jgi:MFS family permease
VAPVAISISSPFTVPNIRLFVLFRIFFGARFYYPVFAILFLDYGLTLAQFAILNTVWAITIVCLEVPSGAVADLIGRKRMIVLASVFMILEMLVLAVAPMGNQTVVFWAFMINRILSGSAEACASGADEALAYDSLEAVGRKADWPLVMDLQMRWHSMAMIGAMLIGAAVYDPGLIQTVTGWELARTTTVRFPIYLTGIMAVLALATAIRMREQSSTHTVISADETFRQILRAGRWILNTPRALVVIAVALSVESVTRLFLTLDSKYFRLIGIPDAAFGIISAGVAALGFGVPVLARWLVKHRSPTFNFWVMSGTVLVGLIGVALAWPWWGLIWVMPTVAGFYLVNFFASHYLNEITEPKQRATVLSFRSLAQSLAYGMINLLFGVLMAGLRRGMDPATDSFVAALGWLPVYFVAIVIMLAVFSRHRWRTG